MTIAEVSSCQKKKKYSNRDAHLSVCDAQAVPHFSPHAAEEGAATPMFYRLDSGAAAGGGQNLGPSANMSLGDMAQQVSMLELLGLLRAVRIPLEAFLMHVK